MWQGHVIDDDDEQENTTSFYAPTDANQMDVPKMNISDLFSYPSRLYGTIIISFPENYRLNPIKLR